MLGEGVTVGADNVITRGARIFPGVELARRRDQVLDSRRDRDAPIAPTTCPSTTGGEQQMSDGGATATSTARGALARGDRPGRPLRPARRRARAARAPARRAVARGVGDHAGLGHPGGLVVAGMGGSAIGGALARAALGDHASRPIFVTRAYGLPPWTTPDTMVLCASYSGDTEETLACYESAGALGRQAHGRHDRRAPGRDGARRRRARDPAARRLPAARGGRLHDRRRARGRRAVRRRAAADLGDRRRRLAHRAARRRVGPGRPRGLARQGARARPARARSR